MQGQQQQLVVEPTDEPPGLLVAVVRTPHRRLFQIQMIRTQMLGHNDSRVASLTLMTTMKTLNCHLGLRLSEASPERLAKKMAIPRI